MSGASAISEFTHQTIYFFPSRISFILYFRFVSEKDHDCLRQLRSSLPYHSGVEAARAAPSSARLPPTDDGSVSKAIQHFFGQQIMKSLTSACQCAWQAVSLLALNASLDSDVPHICCCFFFCCTLLASMLPVES